MDVAKATAAVHKVLQQIQANCPKLTGATKPLKELEKMTSPVSYAATGMLKRELGLKLDAKINLFGSKKDGAYTIDKTVAILCKAAEEQKKKEAAKA